MHSRLSLINNHFKIAKIAQSQDVVADVAIIGAGITGLSTAVNLKKRNVDKIVIVDSNEKVGTLMKASNVNCGIICDPTFYVSDPLHSELLRRTIESVKDISYLKYVQSGAMYPCLT